MTRIIVAAPAAASERSGLIAKPPATRAGLSEAPANAEAP